VSIASVSSLGTGQSKTAGTSIVLSGVTYSAGDIIVVVVAKDNASAVDGNTNEFVSCEDNSGGINVFTKAREFCNSQGGADGGAVVGVFWCKAAAGVGSGTITVNFSDTRTAKAISAWRFTVGAGNTLQQVGQSDLANDGADPGSMSTSGLANVEHLHVRGIAAESSSTTVLTPTANFTALGGNQTTGGGAAANMAVRGEFRINTSAGETSDPGYTAADCASVLVAFAEITPASESVQDPVGGGVVPFPR
jgi:hypothetical protein